MSLLTSTTNEFVSQYSGYLPNNVWSGLKCVIDVSSGCDLSLVARDTVAPAVEKLTDTPDEFFDLDNMTNVK